MELLITCAEDFRLRLIACEKTIRKEYSDDAMFLQLYTVPD